jgi:hypothetical protein
MVREREARVIIDEPEAPEPEAPEPEAPEPTTNSTEMPRVNLDAQSAYAWGTFLDKAMGHAKTFVEMFIASRNNGTAGTPPATNGATAGGVEPKTNTIIEVTKSMEQPRFDIEKLMGIVDEAITMLVSIKGNEPLENLPPLLAENRQAVKEKLQEALNQCLIVGEAPAQ